MSKTTIYRRMKEGEFPKPRLLSSKKVGFLQVELESWIQDRKIA